tara:strand:+ start:4352 stop:4600 length:249 start_codon:yes stop_codon:yes gene_type:complete
MIPHLPSSVHSYDFIHGKKNSIYGIASDILSRAGLISIGLLILNKKDILRTSLVVSSVIELSVLLYTKTELNREPGEKEERG